MTCPFCGQKQAAVFRFGPSMHFACGTALCASHNIRRFQSKKCAQAEIENLKARIKRLEEAGDSLKEEARPTMFDTDETRKRSMDAISGWDAAREAKP